MHENLRQCADRAADLGITLVLENMNVLPEAAEIRYLGCTALEISDILDSVGSPSLAACLDIGHAHLLPGGVAHFIDVLGARIRYAQLTDNDGVHDDHLALGQGTLDVADTFRRLDAASYTGIISIELSDPADQLESLRHIQSLV